MPRRLVTTAALAAASVLTLVGCAASGAGADDDVITVVASTDVYGHIAQVIGGDTVEVVSIIDSAAQDPHSYEPSARDQLRVSRADLVIENGGGYDTFIDLLIEATGTDAAILTAVEFSRDWPGESAHDGNGHDGAESEAHDHSGHNHIEGFNEHVWYDLGAMSDLAAGIAAQLGALTPGDSARFAARADAFARSISALEDDVAALAVAYGGARIFVTEPVPLYLTEQAELENLTPDAFSEAVEEGQDVAPSTLLKALGMLRSGDVTVVIANTQTGGVETDAVVAEAEAAGIPVLEFSEVLPSGLTYAEWMRLNIVALGKALRG